MSVHQRSPLCKEYEEYYKDGTSKFRKEIDNKIQKDKGDPNRSSIYQSYVENLNMGNESENLIKMKLRLSTTVNST